MKKQCNGAHCKCMDKDCPNPHYGDHECTYAGDKSKLPVFRAPNEFQECDTCANKPGSPLLCEGCVRNRASINSLGKQIEDLCADLALAQDTPASTAYVNVTHPELLSAINELKDILTADKRDEGPTEPLKQPQAPSQHCILGADCRVCCRFCRPFIFRMPWFRSPWTHCCCYSHEHYHI